MEFPVRINKYMADTGLSTRRGADALIEKGLVLVNGTKAVIGQKINQGDTVTLTTQTRPSYRYLLYYKPRGIITHSPSETETDIRMQIEHDHGVRGVFPVGRLDKDSEGLIILTDDGRITKRLLEPQFDHEKEYQILLDKPVTERFLKQISRGVNIEGYITKPAHAERDRRNEYMCTITLTEGKKHQVRRMCTALGYQVRELKRTRILSFSLRPLTSGRFRELNKKERMLLGKSLNLPIT